LNKRRQEALTEGIFSTIIDVGFLSSFVGGWSMPALRLFLLGSLDMRYDGQQLPKPPTLKSQSLLAYLALHRQRPQPRERLATLFWGDRPERRARRSLTTALWHIRRCLPGEDLLLADVHSAQFDPGADLWLDVAEFEELVARPDLPSLQSAVALYRGDFMEGFYDDWVLNERYRLETLFSKSLTRLMSGLEAGGDYVSALAVGLRLLQHDPLREDAHRLAMRAFCRLGQRNAALEQYRRCRQAVQEELGTEPLVETVELCQAILEGRIAIGLAPETLSLQAPVVEPATPLGRSPLDAMAPSSLVGRERELAFLNRRWQEAEAGRGGLVLVSGEAGVGKTRLVEEFAHSRSWQGTRVLCGRCYEFERMLPYQPLAEALRTTLPALTSSAPGDLPAWILREIARLVPEVLEARPDLEATPAIRSDEERARLFDGVTRFVVALAAHETQLIVLEDLHWATASTLQLVHYLVRHLVEHPVLLVGTLRPEAVGRQHPLWALQQQLEREGLAESLPLSRLSPAAVEAMIVEMAGVGETVAPLAARLYRETEGNPFFLIEIVKALFERGVVQLAEGVWKGDYARISEAAIPLPAGVSEAIQARVRCLDEEAQEALRLAAVLGREFDFDLLAAAWGRGEEATLEVLDDLLRHRLIDEGVGSLGRDYAFTHHKIQEVVYIGIPRRRRQRAHAQAGAVLERLYGPEAEAVAGELAFHFQKGKQHGEALTEKAIAYRLQAGDRALALYAHEEAIDHYQQALVMLKERGEHGQAARTLMKLGLTYHNAFHFRQSRQAYEEGFALWQRTGGTGPDTALPPAPHALRLAGTGLSTLDPIKATTGLIDQLFSGLVELSPEMEILPDVARTWQVLEGGRRYIFHLRDDARWSDNTAVTAHDFEYGWKRVLDPATESSAPHLLYDVKAARSFHQGEAEKTSVGVRALDPVTLAVELEGPTGHFPYLLALPITRPVPQHTVEAYGETWADPANVVTNGPFRLEAWHKGRSMRLVRNPSYHGRFRGNVQQVELSYGSHMEWSVELTAYEADELDVLWINLLPATELYQARQRHAGEYASKPELSTYGVAFDASRPPFDDARVRRAFVLAIDREAVADVILRGAGFPATGGFVPPGIPGHSPEIGLPYDPDRARQLMLEAGHPDGSDCGFPILGAEMVFAPVASQVCEYMQAQWREVLGVDFMWEEMDWETYLGRQRTESPHLAVLFWGVDYPDPDCFLRVAVGSTRRVTGWRDEAYDRLVEKARRTMDSAKRLALYQQADRMLIEEAPIMPLAHGRTHLLVKPWVSSLPTAPDRWWFWKDVVIEPH
jgi:ABC-type oligopeptide transport system substrate-binding subunit/DNA-binding SARP family transcriptional activator